MQDHAIYPGIHCVIEVDFLQGHCHPDHALFSLNYSASCAPQLVSMTRSGVIGRFFEAFSTRIFHLSKYAPVTSWQGLIGINHPKLGSSPGIQLPWTPVTLITYYNFSSLYLLLSSF